MIFGPREVVLFMDRIAHLHFTPTSPPLPKSVALAVNQCAEAVIEINIYKYPFVLMDDAHLKLITAYKIFFGI
jgi:hypothetical protein